MAPKATERYRPRAVAPQLEPGVRHLPRGVLLPALLRALALRCRSLPWLLLGFPVILTIDGLATLANSDSTVDIDRSTFFLALLVLSVAQGPGNLFFLFLEVALVVAALDFSFLLRRSRHCRRPVRSQEQAPVLCIHSHPSVPALILLTFLSSFVSEVALPDPVILLAASRHGGALRHLLCVQVPLLAGSSGPTIGEPGSLGTGRHRLVVRTAGAKFGLRVSLPQLRVVFHAEPAGRRRPAPPGKVTEGEKKLLKKWKARHRVRLYISTNHFR